MGEYTQFQRRPRGRSGSRERRPIVVTGGSLSPGAKKEKALAKLEEQVIGQPAETFLDTAKSAGGAIMDLIGRTGHASAGALETIAHGGTPQMATERAAEELLSGLGPFEGQKKNIDQVLEGLGVPAGPSLSGATVLHDTVYSDTGDEWLKFKRGGFFDPTARGIVGLAGDIVTDPATYVGGGAGALKKVGGKAIAETAGQAALRGLRAVENPALREAAKLATSEAKTLSVKGGKELVTAFKAATVDQSTRAAAISALKAADPHMTSMAANAALKRGAEAAPALRDLARAKAEADVLAKAATDPSLLDKGGVHFVTGHTIPGTQVLNPVFNAARQSYRKMSKGFDAVGSLFFVGHRGRNLPGYIEELQKVKPAITDGVAKWEAEIGAAERNFKLNDEAKKRVAIAVDEGKIGTLQGAEKDAAIYIAGKKKEILQADWSAGIKVPPRENYLAHYYLNSVEELERVKIRYGHQYGSLGDLGRHLEDRSFDTLREAVETTTKEHAIDDTVPILKPLYDPFESLRRRATKSVEARGWRGFEQIMDAKFGRPAWVDDQTINDIFDLTQRPTRTLSKQDAQLVTKLVDTPSRQEGQKITREWIAKTPEVRFARKKHQEVMDAAPIKYVEKRVVRNVDEIPFLKREGWDVREMVGDKTVESTAEGAKAAQRAKVLLPRAQKELSEHIAAAPAGSLDREVLKNADEASFYERRGWDVVQVDEAGNAVPLSASEVRAALTAKDKLARAESALRDHLKNPEFAGEAGFNTWKAKTAKMNETIDGLRDTAATLKGDGELVAYRSKPLTDSAHKAWESKHNALKKTVETLDAQGAMADATHIAFRTKDPSRMEYVRWNKKLNETSKFLETVEEKAQREATRSTGPVLYDKIADVKKLSDTGKRAFFEERMAKVASREELVRVMEKYEQFKQYFPKQVGKVGQVAADGTSYVSINLKGLGDKELPESIADEVAALGKGLLRFDTPEGKGLKQVLDAIDWVQNSFKLAATAFPSFHTRNAYSNVAQSFADIGVSAFNPVTRRDTAAILMGRDGVLKTSMGEYSYKEIREMLEKRGVIQPGNSAFEFDKNFDPDRSWFAKKTKARQAVEGVQSKIGGAIENEARVMHAITLIKRGHSIDEAVARVNKFLFDYQNMTQAERHVFKRIFPFWTWTKKNFIQQAENIRLRPGKLANEIKPFRGREDENNRLTSFEDQALKIRLNNDGKTLQVISGIDLPIRNMDLLWRGNWQKTGLGAIGMMSPILKTGVEQATGINAFTGRPMGRVKSDGVAGQLVTALPRPMQNWLGYDPDLKDAAGRPIREFDERRFNLLFKSWVTSRLVSTSDRVFREYVNDAESDGRTDWIGMALDTLTGLRAKELDLDEQWGKRVDERTKALEDALIRAGEKKRGTYTFTPRDRKEQDKRERDERNRMRR